MTMKGNKKKDKIALDQFMQTLFHGILQRVRNFRDPLAQIPQSSNRDIGCMYLMMTGVDGTLSINPKSVWSEQTMRGTKF